MIFLQDFKLFFGLTSKTSFFVEDAQTRKIAGGIFTAAEFEDGCFESVGCFRSGKFREPESHLFVLN